MDAAFQREQQRITEVIQTINNELQQLVGESSQLKNERNDIQKYFWDEVKVNVDSFDDYLETMIGLRQETQALAVNQSMHRHANKKSSKLRKMKDNPYFGRIDFREDREKTTDEIYIGIATLTDEANDEILIYDWRAPISSIYYESEIGPTYYRTPSHKKITGQLEKKIQYMIRDGQLQTMFDASVTIGDEVLQQVLGQSTDKKMHSIVATIQQEQNKIIRHTGSRLLIVHGSAGSGKTSAALQRVAYLLYKYRESMTADQIILFSPNTMFNSYVSNVLPELGEENMQQVTFQDYLEHRLGDEMKLENPYDQLEFILTAKNREGYEQRLQAIKYKASPAYFEAMERYFVSLSEEGMLFHDLIFNGEVIMTKEQLYNQFYSENLGMKLHNRLDLLKESILKLLKETEKKAIKSDWILDEIELISDDRFTKIHKIMAKKKGYRPSEYDEYDLTHRDLAIYLVKRKMNKLRKKVNNVAFIDSKTIYRHLFDWLVQDNLTLWSEIRIDTFRKMDLDELYYEDATPFLFMQELMKGFQTNRQIRHLLIDEAQDYSAFQFEFLKRLFPAANMTVLGDFNQAIFAHAKDTNDFMSLTSLYGEDETAVVNIQRSYRSTKEIIEFTKSIVPNGESIISFNRAGSRPVVTTHTSKKALHDALSKQIHDFQNHGYQSIAVICLSDEECVEAYEALSNIPNIKRVKQSTSEYEVGTVVIPSYLSKGIEFDAVIVYNASTEVYADDSLRKTFYTVCTRAMHALQIHSVGSVTPLLEAVPENRYEMN